jgi:hypothetical protein
MGLMFEFSVALDSRHGAAQWLDIGMHSLELGNMDDEQAIASRKL